MKIALIILIYLSLVISTHTLATDADKIQHDLAQPVNCKTAEGDIRVLESEKAHTAEQIGAGVKSIAPPSLVFHLIEGTEDDQIKVASGEYDKMLDKKIAEIKETCY